MAKKLIIWDSFGKHIYEVKSNGEKYIELSTRTFLNEKLRYNKKESRLECNTSDDFWDVYISDEEIRGASLID